MIDIAIKRLASLCDIIPIEPVRVLHAPESYNIRAGEISEAVQHPRLKPAQKNKSYELISSIIKAISGKLDLNKRFCESQVFSFA